MGQATNLDQYTGNDRVLLKEVEPTFPNLPLFFEVQYSNRRDTSTLCSAEMIDNHYVLRKEINIPGDTRQIVEVFGIEHEKDQAERRLHKAAQREGESLGRKHQTSHLIDTTRYAPESLPRGGK